MTYPCRSAGTGDMHCRDAAGMTCLLRHRPRQLGKSRRARLALLFIALPFSVSPPVPLPPLHSFPLPPRCVPIERRERRRRPACAASRRRRARPVLGKPLLPRTTTAHLTFSPQTFLAPRAPSLLCPPRPRYASPATHDDRPFDFLYAGCPRAPAVAVPVPPLVRLSRRA